jgi:hypothetical protein
MYYTYSLFEQKHSIDFLLFFFGYGSAVDGTTLLISERRDDGHDHEVYEKHYFWTYEKEFIFNMHVFYCLLDACSALPVQTMRAS